ncbi:MAG: sigma-70 family RNA polymerase sigma factor [Gemmatimonadetes bacterium]|nr:sigma-70 family RNA polymerase sigma factor [Gemmatimonadota bacterium]
MHDDELERLFKLYHTPLVRYLTRRLGDRDWAEEVAQETFLRALRQDALTSERSWLFAVATNLVRDEARKDDRRRRHLQLLAAEERERVVESEDVTQERAQERAQEQAMARRAIDALAERDRLALLMREEGLDYNEIAEALGLSVGSIGTTLARARRRLAETYEALQADAQRRAGGNHGTH